MSNINNRNRLILAAIRAKYNLTQKEIAERLELSGNYISMVNTGRAVVSKPLFERLVEVFPDCRETIANLCKDQTDNSGDEVQQFRDELTHEEETGEEIPAADSEELRAAQAEVERLSRENQGLKSLYQESMQQVTELKMKIAELESAKAQETPSSQD